MMAVSSGDMARSPVEASPRGTETESLPSRNYASPAFNEAGPEAEASVLRRSASINGGQPEINANRGATVT